MEVEEGRSKNTRLGTLASMWSLQFPYQTITNQDAALSHREHQPHHLIPSLAVGT